MGSPPPTVIAQTSDGPEQVRQVGPETYERVEQLVITTRSGQTHSLRLHIGMSGDSLRKLLKRQGIEEQEVRPDRLVCSPDKAPHYECIVREVWPQAESNNPTLNPIVPVQEQMEVKDHYFRAILKSVFHYYLTQSRRVTGHEVEFDAVRSFIRHGGEMGPFFRDVPRVFEVSYLTGSRPVACYSHFVAVLEPLAGEVIGFIHYFAGEEHPDTVHHVRLGKISTRLVLPNKPRRWAHEYRFSKVPGDRGHRGQVREPPIFFDANKGIRIIRFA